MGAATAVLCIALFSCSSPPEPASVQEARGDAIILEKGSDFFRAAIIRDRKTGQRVLVVSRGIDSIAAVPLNEKPQPLEGH